MGMASSLHGDFERKHPYSICKVLLGAWRGAEGRGEGLAEGCGVAFGGPPSASIGPHRPLDRKRNGGGGYGHCVALRPAIVEPSSATNRRRAASAIDTVERAPWTARSAQVFNARHVHSHFYVSIKF